jgi:hypothetical protein
VLCQNGAKTKDTEQKLQEKIFSPEGDSKWWLG